MLLLASSASFTSQSFFFNFFDVLFFVHISFLLFGCIFTFAFLLLCLYSRPLFHFFVFYFSSSSSLYSCLFFFFFFLCPSKLVSLYFPFQLVFLQFFILLPFFFSFSRFIRFCFLLHFLILYLFLFPFSPLYFPSSLPPLLNFFLSVLFSSILFLHFFFSFHTGSCSIASCPVSAQMRLRL